jgi:mannose-6-phosphate isomerase-like protein (cupin superfamily)
MPQSNPRMPDEPRILKPDETDETFIDEGCHILELSNTAHDPALSIARARVAPGVTTRLHRLADTAERYVILSGKGQAEIGGQPPVDVSSGDVVLIPPGCPQRIRNTGSEDLVFLAICTPRFTVSAYEDLGE